MSMRTLGCLVLIAVCAVSVARADFLSPLADARVGTTVTDGGQIVAVERKDGGTDYFVRCRTDTGPADIPAEIPAELLRAAVVGRPARITATVRERENPTTKARTRYLEVTKIEILQ